MGKVGVILILMAISAATWAEGFEEVDRDIASVGTPTVVPFKAKSFAGGADEEDLKVMSAFPEAPLSTDSRSIQRDVYKDLYKQELKDERSELTEE